MKILGYVGVLVLATTFLFPLSAGAFGDRPPSDPEVTQSRQAKLTPTKAATTTTNQTGTEGTTPNGTPQAVPEPSSFLLIGIALGLVAVISMRKRSHQTAE